MPPKFQRKRWRRPQRLMLDESQTVVRRKDVTVADVLTLQPELVWHANRRRMAILLVAFGALAALEGFAIGLITSTLWPFVPALGLAFLYVVVGARFGDGWMRTILKAHPADAPATRNLLESVAREAKIPVPELLVCSGDAPNAISLGLRRRWLLVTDGVLAMSRIEQEGLLAHEISHLAGGDAALASAYVLIAGAMELGTKGLSAPGGVLALLAVPLWPACFLLRAFASVLVPADREHRADVAGALMTRYPPGTRAVLRAAAVEQSDSRLRTTDPFWLAPRSPSGGPDIAKRAELIAEM